MTNLIEFDFLSILTLNFHRTCDFQCIFLFSLQKNSVLFNSVAQPKGMFWISGHEFNFVFKHTFKNNYTQHLIMT